MLDLEGEGWENGRLLGRLDEAYRFVGENKDWTERGRVVLLDLLAGIVSDGYEADHDALCGAGRWRDLGLEPVDATDQDATIAG